MLKSLVLKTYDDYIKYLGKMSVPDCQFSKIFKIPPILDITKPIPPVFTAGQFNRNDIIKRLGKVNFPNAKPEKRKIQPMDSEAVTTRMISTEKQLEQSKRNPTRNKHCLCLLLLPWSESSVYQVFMKHGSMAYISREIRQTLGQ